MKAFPDDKIDVTQKFKFGLIQIENIIEKWENAGFSDLRQKLPSQEFWPVTVCSFVYATDWATKLAGWLYWGLTLL